MTKIFIYDEFNPEDNAMLQALYSRSSQSVADHVEKVRKTGSGKFMEQYYVGYGHQSIADCGSTTLFIEGLSMLADKAIQDWPLYSGQESSSRYIDYAKQEIVDPVATKESKTILDKWMIFYTKSQEEVKQHLRKKYPKKKDEKEATYEKAINARTFDILRGFLPAGVQTQLSWHTNLRQAWDKLSLLKYHPLKETKEIAQEMIDQLKEKYSNSFSHRLHKETEDYKEKIVKNYNYFNPSKFTNDFECRTDISNDDLQKYEYAIKNRPAKTNLPLFLGELGNIIFDFVMDFGSFRDIQRHRNGTCRMPLLTTDRGFNSWYLEQLPDDLREKGKKLIKEQIESIKNLGADEEDRQYYIAMGFNVACRVSYGLPATVYVVELRAGKAVHPTLRKIAHKMHYALKEKFNELTLHSDLAQDDWDVRRGLQDISKK